MAEAEVVAHDHVAYRQSLAQHLVREVLGAHRRQDLVEVQGRQEVHVQGLDQPRLDPEGREPEGRRVGREEAARVRLEGQDGSGRAQDLGQAAGLGDHLLVATVDAVEIADGDHRPFQCLRYVMIVTQNQHGPPAPSMPAGHPRGGPSLTRPAESV